MSYIVKPLQISHITFKKSSKIHFLQLLHDIRNFPE